MKVIIIKPTKKLKKIGEIVQVKKGYARNYLIPNEIAIRATADNQNKIIELKKDLDLKYQIYHQEALAAMDKINNCVVTFIQQSLEDGRLFGSITAKQIAQKIDQEYQIELKSQQILIDVPLKNLGTYIVSIALTNEITANMFVNIARSDSEGINQLNNFKASLDTSTNS